MIDIFKVKKASSLLIALLAVLLVGHIDMLPYANAVEAKEALVDSEAKNELNLEQALKLQRESYQGYLDASLRLKELQYEKKVGQIDNDIAQLENLKQEVQSDVTKIDQLIT